MTLSTIDPRPALVLIDLQKGFMTRPTVHPVDEIVRWGAFHDTALHERLQELGVTQIVLAGVRTSVGVESTARAGYEHGYHVVLATDAMTDSSAYAHQNSVERIFPDLGQTTTTDEVLDLLEKSR